MDEFVPVVRLPNGVTQRVTIEADSSGKARQCWKHSMGVAACRRWIGRRGGEGNRMNGLIAAAIERRRLLKLVYSVGSRIVEPHVYGLTGCGKELLRCYQVAGESASRERAG
jgi:hypothetical protein